MSDCAINWHRESLINHGDGTFVFASNFFSILRYFSTEKYNDFALRLLDLAKQNDFEIH